MRLIAVLFVLLNLLSLASGSEIRVWGPATTCPEVLTVPAGLNDAVQLAAGLHHIIALKADGTVVAWGKNDVGQLNVPAGLTGVVKIQAGGDSNLAIRGDNTFVMWGDNSVHQTDIPGGLTNITSGAVSFYDTVAILPNGSLRQWGDFATGVIPAVTTAQEAGIEAGLGLVRLSNFSVVMWHDASQPTTRLNALTPPSGLVASRLFGPVYETAVAITSSGSLEIWGQKPLLISQKPTGSLDSNFTDIAIGVNHILGTKLDGTMLTWGSSAVDTPKLAIPSGWSSPIRIACGKQFSAALWPTNAPNGSGPSLIQLTPALAIPGSPTGTTIGILTATDGDPGDHHIFSFTGGIGGEDNGLFAINGDLILTSQAIPLRQGSFSVRIHAIDSGGIVREEVIHISAQSSGSSPNQPNDSSNDESGRCGLGNTGLAVIFLLNCIIFLRKLI